MRVELLRFVEVSCGAPSVGGSLSAADQRARPLLTRLNALNLVQYSEGTWQGPVSCLYYTRVLNYLLNFTEQYLLLQTYLLTNKNNTNKSSSKHLGLSNYA